MPTPGFFQQQLDPNYAKWYSDEHVSYIQREVAKRLRNEHRYLEYIEVGCDDVREMLESTHGKWHDPIGLQSLLEMVITNFVTDIDTDLQQQRQFSHCNPRTLYFPGTGITREERVKLNPGYKFEFQMNY